MSTTKRASARWRKKKLEENPENFRAKEALRIKNYRARKKGGNPQMHLGQDISTMQDTTDDVDTWFNSFVDDTPCSSHVPLPRPASPAWSSTSSSNKSSNSHDKDNETLSPPRPSIISFQDAREIVANGRKILQEWNKRWGSVANFSFRAVNVFLKFGHTTADYQYAHRELLAIVQKGREVLSQVESIAFINLQSIKVEEFPDFWIETLRVVEGLHEQMSVAKAVLRLHSEQSRM